MTTRVFVYGTLLRGLHNSYLLDGSMLVAETETAPAFTMRDLGGCPMLHKGGTTAIRGEVFDVFPEALRRLDRLEGHPDFYCREEVTLANGMRAWVYLASAGYDRRLNDFNANTVASGCWRTHRAERGW